MLVVPATNKDGSTMKPTSKPLSNSSNGVHRRIIKKDQEHDEVENGIGPFAMVPKWLFASVSDGAVMLYISLWLYISPNDPKRKAFPSKSSLAKDMSCSIDTVDRRLKELVEARAVTVKKKPSAHGGWPHNIYFLKLERP